VSPPWLIVSGLIALVLLLYGLRSLRRKRLLENVPTSKARGVFLGLNEVKGRARTDAPLTSYLSGTRCVHYRYEVEEHWSRTVTYTDSKGKTQTRHESGWTTVDSGGESAPFEVEDETGRLRVVPDGAEITATQVFSETCDEDDPLYYAKGPREAVSDSEHERRFTEHAIAVGEEVYVIGCARLREDRVEPEIARDRDAELFLISTDTEEEIVSGYGYATFFPLLFGTAAAFLFPVGVSFERGFGQALRLEPPRCVAVGGGYLGFVAAMYLVFVYNGLAEVKRRAEMAWSMIEVQLKRRHDLIPLLVACVRGYAKHEEETQRFAAALRVEGGRGEEGGALRGVLAVAERYPDLKASPVYERLHAELVDAEDRIAFAREFHNAAVTALNNRRETMPDALVARLTGLKAGTWLAAEGFERASVRVSS
jgi:hypothetical protein